MKSVPVRRPFSLPTVVDRLRNRLATLSSTIRSERVDDRINRLFVEFQNSHREWVVKGVNQTFIEERVKPLVALYRQYRRWPTALEIALDWDETYGNGKLIDRKLEVARLAHALGPFVERLKHR